MSSRRSRASKITDDEINDLILKLQPLLPQLNRRGNGRVSASEVLKEACDYVKRLQSEADDLSERLSQMLDSNGVDVNAMLRNLLQQYSLAN